MTAKKINTLQKTILVVDDNKEILEYIRRGLGQYGYTIITAENGKKALSVLQNKPVRFALIDIRLPDINGIELSKKIVSMDSKMVIILMTGYPEVRNVLKILQNQIYDYIIKPFRIQQLLIAINRAYQHAELLRQRDHYKVRTTELQKENEDLKLEIRKLIGPASRDNKRVDNRPRLNKKIINSYKQHQNYSDQMRTPEESSSK